jgi:hypothetical protein
MEELELQRKEIQENRRVMEDQEEQLSLQRETMQRQQFEATFFQMLNLLNDRVNRLKYGSGAFLTTGEEAFGRLEKSVISILVAKTGTSEDGNKRPRMEWVPTAMQKEAFDALRILRTFLTIVDTILELIEERDEDSKQYDEILRVNLSPYSVFWIGIRGLYDIKIKESIEQHSLLKYLTDYHVSAFAQLEYYSPQAFG